MTEARQQNAPLIVGVVIALVLHLLIGAPILRASWGVGGTSPLNSALDGNSEAERRQRERLAQALKELQETPPEDDLVKPGLEDGSDQGMAWIGYDEYQEHIARHAEVDQAAFTEQNAAGGGALAQGAQHEGPQVQPVAPTPPAPPVAAAGDNPATQQPVTPAQPPVEAVRAASTSESATPSDATGVAPAQALPSDLPTAPRADDPDVPAINRPEISPSPDSQNPPTAPISPSQTPEPVAREAQPEQPTQQIPSVTPANPLPAQPAQPPAQPSPAGATSPNISPIPAPPGSAGTGQQQGEKSDRESDATSIIDAPPSKWRTGKPLAQKGLEVLTKKPELPILTRLSTRPGNPVCEILFGRDGKPVTCRILQSSGFEDVDGPVLDALYRWRAKGQQLEKLAPGKTLRFRVRFLLD